MTQPQLEIQLIAGLVAVACALPGTFLVLRRLAMMSDAISHTVLLGIVLAFFVAGSLDSPLLLLGAALMGVLTTALVALLQQTQLVREDAAIGLVFPALFSLAILLISRFAGHVHLDVDAVLLGELAFAPFERVRWAGLDFGPLALASSSALALLNLALVVIFYKELKLTTFDPSLAAALGFSPVVLHYGLMAVVSITAVTAFDSVGSVLVIALMVAPPAAAYLLTNRLSQMLFYGALIGVLSAIVGYWLAHWFDTTIAGAMASVSGLCFLVSYLFAPEQGMLVRWRRQQAQRLAFAQTMLTMHIANHQDTAAARAENAIASLHEHLHWSPTFTAQVVAQALSNQLVQQADDGLLWLTDAGKKRASQLL